MAKRQTRRSISVRATTELRISQFAKDHGISTSGFVEEVIAAKLGDATSDDPTLYEAERAKQLPAVSSAPFPTLSDSPKIGSDHGLPDTTKKKRPRFNQPKPEPLKGEGEEEPPEEMRGYVKPLLLF